MSGLHITLGLYNDVLYKVMPFIDACVCTEC